MLADLGRSGVCSCGHAHMSDGQPTDMCMKFSCPCDGYERANDVKPSFRQQSGYPASGPFVGTPPPAVRQAAVIVHDGRWPHGLRCGECGSEIAIGAHYVEQLGAPIDGVNTVVPVCPPCGLIHPVSGGSTYA